MQIDFIPEPSSLNDYPHLFDNMLILSGVSLYTKETKLLFSFGMSYDSRRRRQIKSISSIDYHLICHNPIQNQVSHRW